MSFVEGIEKRRCFINTSKKEAGNKNLFAIPAYSFRLCSPSQSVVGNVVHTLIEVDHDRVKLLEENSSTACQDAVSTLDHIALACRVGKNIVQILYYKIPAIFD